MSIRKFQLPSHSDSSPPTDLRISITEFACLAVLSYIFDNSQKHCSRQQRLTPKTHTHKQIKIQLLSYSKKCQAQIPCRTINSALPFCRLLTESIHYYHYIFACLNFPSTASDSCHQEINLFARRRYEILSNTATTPSRLSLWRMLSGAKIFPSLGRLKRKPHTHSFNRKLGTI